MKISKVTKIGILTAVCIAILIWGMNYLSGHDLFMSENVYLARYSNVGGLEASTDVTLNGFKVGYVKDIYFAEDRSSNLIVKLAITKKFNLPEGTKAEIVSSDLLGSRGVQLTLGKGDSFYEPYDTLQTGLEADIKSQVSEQIAPLKAKAENLLSTLDSAVNTIALIFNEESRKNLNESLSNLNKLTGDLKDLVDAEGDNVASIIRNLDMVSSNLNNNSEKINQIFSNFSDFSDTLASIELKNSLKNLGEAVDNFQQITEKMEAGDGTMGKLLNDPILYQNLSSTAENLNRLIIDLRQNPKRYIHMSALDFGKDIYITPDPDAEKNSGISYKILLMSSDMAIPVSSPLFDNIDNVEEFKNGSKYNYLTGDENSIYEIKMILNNMKNSFPDASIIAFKNGKKIKLKKALKSTSK